MKMKNAFITFIIISTAIALCPSVYAKSKSTAKPTPVIKTQPYTISSVSADSITVAHDKVELNKGSKKVEKTTKTYKIISTTEITINGTAASAKMLQPGMLVSVSASAALNDSAESIATTISAHTASGK